jgi:hypothetical protein
MDGDKDGPFPRRGEGHREKDFSKPDKTVTVSSPETSAAAKAGAGHGAEERRSSSAVLPPVNSPASAGLLCPSMVDRRCKSSRELATASEAQLREGPSWKSAERKPCADGQEPDTRRRRQGEQAMDCEALVAEPGGKSGGAGKDRVLTWGDLV